MEKLFSLSLQKDFYSFVAGLLHNKCNHKHICVCLKNDLQLFFNAMYAQKKTLTIEYILNEGKA